MRTQFQVLYREFLFRMIDLELLSTQGDTSRLLGQFGALLFYISSMLGLGALFFDGRRMTSEALLVAYWRIEHSYISITILVVGLFTVLSWDSTFPDRRDVLVLAPLPIRTRTLFLAKVAALGAALSITVLAINACTGIAWPLALALADSVSPLDLIFSLTFYQAFFAFWVTMMSTGAFIFCSVLSLQGLAAQLLPRGWFLRVSGFLQMSAFGLFLSLFFLEPPLGRPQALTAPENQRLLAQLPSYWFLGVFHQLNGSMHPALGTLARRGWIGLIVAGAGAGVTLLLSYFRTLRKIADEPDIAPGRMGWSPRLGNSITAALLMFSARTLLRSRRHRMMLAFYVGIGFAVVIALLKTFPARQQLITARVPLMFASAVMMGVWVVGVRVVFSLPLALPANWMFRITEVRRAPEYFAAIRLSLCVLAVAPVWTVSAALFLSIWPARPAAGHLVLLALLGMTLAYLCLYGFQKIPFTCSYLPGKTYFHMVFLAAWGILALLLEGVGYELRALEDPASYARMLLILGAAVLLARWRTVSRAKSADAALQFEEIPPPVIFALDLHNERKMVR